MTIVKKHTRKTKKGRISVKAHGRKVRKKTIYKKMNYQRKLNRESADRIDSMRDRLTHQSNRDNVLRILDSIDIEKKEIQGRSIKILNMEKTL